MSLVNTLTQSLRSKYVPLTMDKNELRFSQYGVWDFFQKQSAVAGGVLTPEAKALIEKSMGNTVNVPVIDAEDVTISNVRSCTVAADENTSKLVTLTFVTYSFGFTMYPAQHANNDISYQADYDRKLKKYLLKFAATLDTAGYNKLNTDKNQYFPADITSYYANVGNALQVAQAQKADFFNQAQSILQTMDYYDTPHVVGSTKLNPMINRLTAQGVGNGVNESFQFSPYEWHTSNRVPNAVGIESTLFLIPDGNVAVHSRNSPDARMKSRTGNGKIWDTVQMPIVNLEMGSFYYDDCANAYTDLAFAGAAHLTQSRVEAFSFDTDLCFVTAYNSDPTTRYSPIVKAEISAS